MELKTVKVNAHYGYFGSKSIEVADGLENLDLVEFSLETAIKFYKKDEFSKASETVPQQIAQKLMETMQIGKIDLCMMLSLYPEVLHIISSMPITKFEGDEFVNIGLLDEKMKENNIDHFPIAVVNLDTLHFIKTGKTDPKFDEIERKFAIADLISKLLNNVSLACVYSIVPPIKPLGKSNPTDNVLLFPSLIRLRA